MQTMSDKFKITYRIKSDRLAGYDYRNEGLYFVTICTKNKFHYFGEIENSNLLLNEIGLIAQLFVVCRQAIVLRLRMHK